MTKSVVSVDVVGTHYRLLYCCECGRHDLDMDGLESDDPDRWPLREMYRLDNGAIICEACLETLDLWEDGGT